MLAAELLRWSEITSNVNAFSTTSLAVHDSVIRAPGSFASSSDLVVVAQRRGGPLLAPPRST
jgi:hypothetical protein